MPEANTFTTRVVVVTLAVILMAVVAVMMWGLFDTRVDNNKIFEIIGPAFQMIVGVFVGILGGREMGRRENQP